MKRVFLLLTAMISGGIVLAQGVNKSKHTQMLQMLLQPQQRNSARMVQKTTTTKHRVIAQSTYQSSPAAMTDSVSLTYTGLRNSTYDYNLMFYPYYYPYATSPMFNYLGTFTTPQVLADNIGHWTVNPLTNVFGLYDIGHATYDTTKLLMYSQTFIDSVSNQNMNFINSFNGGGNITLGQWFNFNMGVNDSAFRQYFSYNAAGKLIADSIYEYHLATWKLVSKTNYTYDAANNLTAIDQWANASDTSLTLPLVEQLMYVNTYDASGRLLTVLTRLFDGTALTDYVRDTFAYTGANTFHSSWKEYQWDPVNTYWAPLVYMQKHLNAANKPDTVTTNTFDSLANAWTPYYRDVITYNANNDPVRLDDYVYNFTAFPTTPDYVTNYYYEDYTDVTGVKQVAASSNGGVVYPNPAVSNVAMAKLGVADNTSVVVSFTNIKGQLANRQYVRYHEGVQLDIANLAPGIYNVMVSDGDGKVIHSQQLVKQ